MINILKKFKINEFTYVFLLICFLCGYIKNVLIIYSICIIHELGHVFFIKLFKYKINSINIYPFGGYTSIEKDINSPINKDIIITLGGILFQIFLYIIIYFFNDYNIFLYNELLYYNSIILIFNILPIIPLDGSVLIRLIIEKYYSYYISSIIYYILSFISLIIFITINFIYKYNNYFIILLLIIKLIFDLKEYKYRYSRFLLERYLNNYDYKRIDNNTKNIKDLKKEVFHYFRKNNKYINEKKVIENNMCCKKIDKYNVF